MHFFQMGNEPGKMVIFSGRAGFSPNTLNNQVFTYAFAKWWEQQNTLEMMKGTKNQKFTFQNWMKLIYDMYEFEKDWKNFEKQSLSLFNHLIINGDGMLLTEIKAIAAFDPSQDTEIKIFNLNEQFLLSEKFGQNRASLADQDPDAQFLPKLYSMTLNYKNDSSVHFNPSVFDFQNIRTENYISYPSASQAEIFLIGTEIKHLGKPTEKKNKYLEYFNNRNVFMKMVMYRYNFTTKGGSLMGYIQSTGNKINSPGFQGWRSVILKKENQKFPRVIQLRSTKKGLLVDMTNAVSDYNTSQYTPIYPKKSVLQLKWKGKIQLKYDLNIEEILLNCGGITFFPDMPPMPNSPIEVTFSFLFAESQKQFVYYGIEDEITLHMEDGAKKNQPVEGIPLSQTFYKTAIEFKLWSTSHGLPLNGEISLSINTSFYVNSGGIKQYENKTVGYFESLMNRKLEEDEEFKKKYKNFDNIHENVYQGNLKSIINIANEMKKNFTQNFSWKSLVTGEPFQLRFLDKNGVKTNKTTANFVDGEAVVKIVLNQDLTFENNPRREWFDKIALKGHLHANIEEKKSSNQFVFYAIFFQTETNKIDQKSDWVHDVGPYLRQNALLYPQMQNILDLYNFKSILLPSMKRTFDIEDENNRRYMPSTRETSILNHRKVQRWLYEPIFNKKSIFSSLKTQKKQQVPNVGKIIPVTFVNFVEMKIKLIEKLRIAWQIEFFTIPIYLSAQFTSPNKLTQNLIRSVVKDQMKHLFIVSNVLNAVHDEKNLPGKAVPFSDVNLIPNYPSSLKSVFQVQNKNLKQFLIFDILPCTPEQILKFACLQLPAEIKNLKFKYLGHPETQQIDGQRSKRIFILENIVNDFSKELQNNENFKTIGQFYSELMDLLWDLTDIERYLNSKGEKVKIFSGDSRQQFSYFGLENMNGVYDLRSCMDQMRLIVEEGEGASLLTLTGENNKRSHFIKFIEIYSMCSVNITTKYAESELTEIIFQFQDDGYMLSTENEHWNEKTDQQVDRKIKTEFEIERESTLRHFEDFEKPNSIPLYPSIYAKPAFKNIYEKVVEDLDLIFNTNIDDFRSLIEKEGLTEKEIQRQFEVYRRKKMEDSIAKMRQMTIYSNIIMHPEGVNNKTANIGSRPNYNIDFSGKSDFDYPAKKSN